MTCAACSMFLSIFFLFGYFGGINQNCFKPSGEEVFFDLYFHTKMCISQPCPTDRITL